MGIVRRFESVLYRGITNREFKCSFIYTLQTEGKFKNVIEKEQGSYIVYPGYILNVCEGYERPNLYISPRRYFPFVTLVNKTVKLVQENLYDLFPNVGRLEFEINERTLARFQTEQALNTANITMMPAVWVDSTNQCYPGIRITDEEKSLSVTIPLEDAIAFSEFLHGFDPNSYGTMMLFNMGRFE